MMKQILASAFFLFTLSQSTLFGQGKTTVKEYEKLFPTYAFNDPDPVPRVGKIYPYWRFDGYAAQPANKAWKVVELENEFVKVMIMPQIGGKIWAAIEKSTGESFLYYNHVVKFRDVAMRGPWTSGGIEANYGIIGHTPNCATPVDYRILQKEDGSASCVIGVFDLLTRTYWSIDINLQPDKAYFTTHSFWYNSTVFEQPYYTWMNTAIKASDDLEFIYPGTQYLGHEGEHADWPVNKQNGRKISFYKNNDFGTYKSYHVFGKYSEFFGGFWHAKNFGMGRYSSHDDKPGKKLWIWGLSQQGMIWEKLLSDTDGQYVEVQSGRLFNQAAEGSNLTPFKNRGFEPHSSDTWTEYWFPVVKTNGYVAANNFGVLNVYSEEGWLKIYFSPLQRIHDSLKITVDGKVIKAALLDKSPLALWKDSVKIDDLDTGAIHAVLRNNLLEYSSAPGDKDLSRPTDSPGGFDWSSAYGLYIRGEEYLHERLYVEAQEELEQSISKDSNFIPSLVSYGKLLYRNMQDEKALIFLKRALSLNTYDPAANFYYGVVNARLGKVYDAKDGFDIAAASVEYRSAAWTELAKIYFREGNPGRAVDYCGKSIAYNHYAIQAWQLLAIAARKNQDEQSANKYLDSILSFDPLNHLAMFEKYLLDKNSSSKELFTAMIRDEQPQQTYLETAIFYHSLGLDGEALQVLKLSPKNLVVNYWLAHLSGEPLDIDDSDVAMTFPFRWETASVLENLIKTNSSWVLKYHLALIYWHHNNIEKAKGLFKSLGDTPGLAAFYVARAELFANDSTTDVLKDLKHALALDPAQWRYHLAVINYYESHNDLQSALGQAEMAAKRFPGDYIIGTNYIKLLALDGDYKKADKLLSQIHILPNEGATEGRQIYREVKLMLAIMALRKKQYSQAMSFVNEARLWPENLGVGQPYAEDIDNMLEDWIEATIAEKQNKQAVADIAWKRILDFTGKHESEKPSPLSLVSLMAYERTDHSGATEYLEKLNKKDPANPWIEWIEATSQSGKSELPAGAESNDNIRIISALLNSNKK